MQQTFTEGETYDKVDFKSGPLKRGEYDNCRFLHCDLSGTDLSGIQFTACDFTGCNLSMAKLSNTAFREVTFRDCKMLGLPFDTCNGFGLSFRFEQCILNHSVFYRAKIRSTVFRDSHLLEADFTECDLTGSVFERCDLAGAVFDHTVLEKADLRTALHYSIDPETNRIKKAQFSLAGIAGLLDKYDIAIED